MRQLLLTALGVALMAEGTDAQAQNTDFVTMNLYIDNVQQPKTILDGARECSNNAGCMAFMRAVDNYFQVPASKIVTVAGRIAPAGSGEGRQVTATLPDGYAYCKSTMRMVSIVPHDGDRGSLFFGAARPNAFYYETWTPVLGPFDGRSWVEAGVMVLGIRQSLADAAYADGTCYRPNRVLFYCRGGGCSNTEDRGQSKEAASPPGANSAKE